MSTSEPTQVKLTKVGDTLTLSVMKCAPMKMGSYPEIQFVGIDSEKRFVEIRVSQKAADRQLGRLDLTYDTAVGKVLEFGRSANPADAKKPFWDITLGDGDFVQAPAGTVAPSGTQSANSASPAAAAPRGEKLSAIYERVTKHVIEKIIPLYKAAGIPIDMQGTHAIVATLFITATRN